MRLIVPFFALLLGVSCSFGPSDYATRLADHQARETAIPCEAHARGATVKLGDWEVRFGTPQLVEGEARSPWIRNASEREAFEVPGTMALVVPFERRNTTPVLAKDDLRYELRLPDGSTTMPAPSNTALQNERAGTEAPWERPESPPDTWVKSAYVFPVDPGKAPEAVMYVYAKEGKKEGFRRSETLVAHVIVDLGRPEEGPSLKQAGP